MEKEKADKTLKATVRKAVESLEQQCQKMKEQLFEIKTEVKVKASEIVAGAKAKGKAALHKVSEFLGIKDKLVSVRENVRKSITETEHTINKLDAFGSGMREAGQKIANTFRTFADKETVDYSLREKKFSKTELVKKPFEAKKKLSDEAVESLKSQLTSNLPENTRNTLLANLDHARKQGSVVQSASNEQLAGTVKALFQNLNLRDGNAVNEAYAKYREIMTPIYRANGIENTMNHDSLSHVLEQDVNRFSAQIANAKAVLNNIGSSVDISV